MIRVNRPEIEPLPLVRLYREDLEKLFSLFKETCQRVVLADDEHSYESVAEIADNVERLSVLHLSGFIPHAELLVKGARKTKLHIPRSTLWIMEPNDKSRLLFLEARNLLFNRRWHFKEIASIAAMIVGTVVLIGSSVFRAIIRQYGSQGEIKAELVGLLGLSVLFLGAFFYFERVSYISLESRTKIQSFWKRNSDKILVAIVSAAIGAAFTLLVKWLTQPK